LTDRNQPVIQDFESSDEDEQQMYGGIGGGMPLLGNRQ